MQQINLLRTIMFAKQLFSIDGWFFLVLTFWIVNVVFPLRNGFLLLKRVPVILLMEKKRNRHEGKFFYAGFILVHN